MKQTNKDLDLTTHMHRSTAIRVFSPSKVYVPKYMELTQNIPHGQTHVTLKNFLTLQGSLKRQTDANNTEHSTLCTYTRAFPTAKLTWS